MPQSIRRVALILGLIVLIGASLAPSASASSSAFGPSEEPNEGFGPALPPAPSSSLGGAEPGTLPEPGPGKARYIVVLKDSVTRPGKVGRSQALGRQGKVSFVYDRVLNGYAATLPKDRVAGLRKDSRVRYVVRDRKVRVADQSTPTGIERSFAASSGGLAINEGDDLRVDADVAVIDTGIDFEHPDLNVVSRADCTSADGDPEAQECVDHAGYDVYGHGTHVAGTIGALDNGEGVVGVAAGARMWSVKVLGADGVGYDAWVLAGIEWVTEHEEEIEVANMSLGRQGSSAPINEALKASVEAGVVYAVAAGNNAADAEGFSPAGHPDVITVSALADYDGKAGGEAEPTCSDRGPDDTLADFSNYGKAVEVIAPGVCILSTFPTTGSLLGTDYGAISGTSMASPHVAGAAAILASDSNPEDKEDVEAVRDTILEEGSEAWEDTSGDGVQERLLDVGDETAFAPSDQVAVTGEAQIVAESEATLRGLVNPAGVETEYHFEYGESTEYGTSIPVSGGDAGSGEQYGEVEETLEGLEGQTLYHYRLVAVNEAGTFYGADRTFGTTPQAVETLSASEVGASSAVLNAGINPNGFLTAYRFEYGTTSSYGRFSPLLAPTVVGSGTETVVVNEGVGALNGNTTYHYRVVADSLAGRVYGEDKTFTTAPASWTVQSTPNPLIAEGEDEVESAAGLLGVSCMSPSECVAVGASRSPGAPLVSPGEHPIAQRWGGSEWSSLEVPDPNGAEFSILEGVSCADSTMCMAIGTYEVEEELYEPLVERWDGEEWSSESVPAPPGSEENVLLEDIACPSTGVCMAVGLYFVAQEAKPLIMAWEGGEWTLLESPIADALRTVSCVSPEACTIAGARESAHWDGDEWTPQGEVPVPPGATAVALREMDCPTTDTCVAVALAIAQSSFRSAVARWDGEEWSAQVLPELSGEEFSQLNDISCVSAVSCASVGFGWVYASVSPIAWRLTAGEWHQRPPAVPGEHNFAEMQAVSCPTAPGCTTTGYYLDQELKLSTLAERYVPSPAAVTGPATDVTVGGATLNAVVNPEGSATHYRLEYGPTTEYGSFAPAEPEAIGSGEEDVAVEQAIEGLNPDTTYHFRVVATNEEGTTKGEDRQFTTPSVQALGEKGSGNGQFKSPSDAAVDSEGNVWVTDTENNRIQKFDPAGQYLDQAGEAGTGNGQLVYPWGIAVDSEDDVWVTDAGNNRIQQFDSEGQYLGQFGEEGSGNGQLSFPAGIAVDSEGNVWVADTFNNRVQRFDPEGEYLDQLGEEGSANGELNTPMDVALSPEGSLWVADTAGNRVQEFGPAGNYLGKRGTEGSEVGELKEPRGLAVNAAGDLWVADTANDRIQLWPHSDAPGASTEAASVWLAEDATLKATIRPRGLATTYSFQYGTSTEYGSTVPASPESAGSGSGEVSVEEPLEGLSPETTYHYRVVASNAAGTSYGEDMAFTTKEADARPWGLEGEVIGEPQQVELDGGTIHFEWLGNGLECPVGAEATLAPPDEGQIDAFEIDVEACQTFGGSYGSCQVTDATAEAPFGLQARKEDVLVSGFAFTLTFNEGCFVSGWEVEGKAEAEITATPDSVWLLGSFDLGGEVEITYVGAPTVVTTTLKGDPFEVTPAETYSIIQEP